MKTKIFFLALLLASFFMACESDDLSNVSPSADTGVGGSYARFIIVGDFMYVVDLQSLITFDVSNAAEPVEVNRQSVGESIESIFNFKDKLFIGSSEGLFIYAIEEDGLPKQLSATSYFEFEIFPCDPVVANDTFAYVTLNAKRRVGNACGGSFEIDVNVLKIFDITDPTNPNLLMDYPMFAPKGVGIDGTTLFVCDDEEGLKIFDASNPYNILPIEVFDDFTAFDVIPLNGLLLVVGPKNIYEFDYTNLDDITLISSFQYAN
ncbi:MAG: hypothetical protein AAF242_07900 [Bacteroidota bacterium]